MQLYDWARDRMADSLPSLDFATDSAQPDAVSSVAGTTADAATTSGDQESAVVTPRTPPVNLLLMGTDERPGEGGPQRTDTLILATLDLESQTAGMLSLPRDLWVPFPGLNMTSKINTAYGVGQAERYPGGGAQLVVDTVSSFVGQPVPYYVRINFSGFTELVDLIGGIDINVPKTIHDDQYPIAGAEEEHGVELFHLDAGYQHLDGETALKYARTRNVDDDYGRSRRQQDVIRAVVDRVTSANMLPTLLASAPQLLATLRNSVDTNIPLTKLLELASYVNDNPPREIRQLVLDSRYGQETYSADGMWILLPDRSKVRAAVNTFFTPPALTSEAMASSVSPDPNMVHIEVLNGSGTQGLAAQVRDLLEAKGWKVVSIGDADRGDYAQSVIINYGVSDAVVQQVSNALGMQPALASVSGLNSDTHVDVRVVLGQDLVPQLSNP
jgi:LCP family protein required for cell wall assembly